MLKKTEILKWNSVINRTAFIGIIFSQFQLAILKSCKNMLLYIMKTKTLL